MVVYHSGTSLIFHILIYFHLNNLVTSLEKGLVLVMLSLYIIINYIPRYFLDFAF